MMEAIAEEAADEDAVLKGSLSCTDPGFRDVMPKLLGQHVFGDAADVTQEVLQSAFEHVDQVEWDDEGEQAILACPWASGRTKLLLRQRLTVACSWVATAAAWRIAQPTPC
jgi:hypothetical protein